MTVEKTEFENDFDNAIKGRRTCSKIFPIEPSISVTEYLKEANQAKNEGRVINVYEATLITVGGTVILFEKA